MKIFVARIDGKGKTGRVSRYFQDRDDAIGYLQNRADLEPLLPSVWDGETISTAPAADLTVAVKGIIVHEPISLELLPTRPV